MDNKGRYTRTTNKQQENVHITRRLGYIHTETERQEKRHTYNKTSLFLFKKGNYFFFLFWIHSDEIFIRAIRSLKKEKKRRETRREFQL